MNNIEVTLDWFFKIMGVLYGLQLSTNDPIANILYRELIDEGEKIVSPENYKILQDSFLILKDYLNKK